MISHAVVKTLRWFFMRFGWLAVVVALIFTRFAVQDHLRLSVLVPSILRDRGITPAAALATSVLSNSSAAQPAACHLALDFVNSAEAEKRLLSMSEQRLGRFVSVACEDDGSLIERFNAKLAAGYRPTAFDVEYLSEIFDRQGQSSEALTLRKSMPDVSLRYVELGRIAIEQLNDEARGLGYFALANQVAPDFDPRKAALYRHLCLIALRSGSIITPRDPCEDFDRAIPSVLARVLLGQRYYSQALYRQAVTALNNAVNLDPTRGDVYYWLGKSWIGLGQSAIAEDYFLQGIRREPDYPWSYLELAQLKLQQGCIDQARMYLDRMKLIKDEAAISAADRMLQEVKQSGNVQRTCP